jgi:hypothetical protein
MSNVPAMPIVIPQRMLSPALCTINQEHLQNEPSGCSLAQRSGVEPLSPVTGTLHPINNSIRFGKLANDGPLNGWLQRAEGES